MNGRAIGGMADTLKRWAAISCDKIPIMVDHPKAWEACFSRRAQLRQLWLERAACGGLHPLPLSAEYASLMAKAVAARNEIAFVENVAPAVVAGASQFPVAEAIEFLRHRLDEPAAPERMLETA